MDCLAPSAHTDYESKEMTEHSPINTQETTNYIAPKIFTINAPPPPPPPKEKKNCTSFNTLKILFKKETNKIKKQSYIARY
jgi:hypothetical protein